MRDDTEMLVNNDEEMGLSTIDDEWWKSDMDYLPIHKFQKQMKRYCLELYSNPPLIRVLAICDEIARFITPEMSKEIEMEYAYYYDKGILENNRPLTQCGYLEYLKHVLTKLIRIFLDRHDNRVLDYILQFHGDWFQKTRYWDDYELDHLDQIVMRIKSR